MSRPVLPPLLALSLVFACLAAFACFACDRAPTADEALYHRAHDAGVSRRSAEAEALYRQLIAQHPQSKFSAEAHVALAELAFNAGAFDTALAEYGAALAFPESKTWSYALYKQGWCHLNRNDPAKARETFQQVIALENDARIPADRRRTLVHEARRDLVKAYAASRGPEGASDYFQRWGGGEATALLESLGELYFEAGKPAEAASIYRELVATHAAAPSPRLCVWQNMIVRTAFANGTHQDQVEEVQHLGAVLARLEQANPGPAAEGCRLTLRDTLKELALLTHKKAQESKRTMPDKGHRLLELADPLYRQYLARFRQEKDAYTMTFYHAEVLWSLGRFAEAAAEYLRVLQLDPKGKLNNEASYAFMLATKNALGIDDEGRAGAAPPAGPLDKPLPLPPAQVQMIAAFDTYLRFVTTGPEVMKVAYRKARTYYDYGHYQTAARLFAALVEQHPDDPLAVFAISLELDALSCAGARTELCRRVQAHASGPQAARDKDLGRTLQALRRDCGRVAP